MKRKEFYRYSEAFKIQVITEYEQGKLGISELSKKYGITGAATINCWLRKYGKNKLLNRVIKVETPEERNRIKELELENKKLKDALAQSFIKQVTAESTMQVMAEELGMTLEELKKKVGVK
jgi:transposase-like protein